MTVLSRSLEGSIVSVAGARGGIGRHFRNSRGGGRIVGTGRGEAPDDLRFDAWLRHDFTSRNDWLQVIDEVQRQFGQYSAGEGNNGLLARAMAELG